jgi:hypothetical protein
MKLFMECESVTQNVLISNAILASLASFIFRKKFHFVVSGLKIIGKKPRQ